MPLQRRRAEEQRVAELQQRELIAFVDEERRAAEARSRLAQVPPAKAPPVVTPPRVQDHRAVASQRRRACAHDAGRQTPYVRGRLITPRRASRAPPPRLPRAGTKAPKKRTRARDAPQRAGVLIEPPATYVVRDGDTLWGIASAHYRAGCLYPLIHQANLSSIPDPNLIFPCQPVRVPRR